jgi:hypothetical protein
MLDKRAAALRKLAGTPEGSAVGAGLLALSVAWADEAGKTIKIDV